MKHHRAKINKKYLGKPGDVLTLNVGDVLDVATPTRANSLARTYIHIETPCCIHVHATEETEWVDITSPPVKYSGVPFMGVGA